MVDLAGLVIVAAYGCYVGWVWRGYVDQRRATRNARPQDGTDG